MEIGSHYYAVLALCRMLEIRKDLAYRIAYSSEFVDDALIERIIFKKVPRGVKCHMFGKRRGLDNTSTCPRIMTMWSYKHRKMFDELVPFHFIPGCRGSTFQQMMRTFPDSPILPELIDSSVRSGDPYSIGIILHVLGDAYAHRGFSGIISRRNRVKGLRIDMSTIRGFSDRLISWYMVNVEWFFTRVFGRILPMYSHSHVGTVPDIASAKWQYKYDNGEFLLARYESSGPVSNPERFKEAFAGMREILTRYIEAHPEVRETAPVVSMDIFNDQLVKPLSRSDTIEEWQRFLLVHDLLDVRDEALLYDPHAWIRKAFANYSKKRYEKNVVLAADPVENFARTDWHRFYLAAREYKEHYDRLLIKYNIY